MPNAYEAVGGSLRLVNRAEDGSVDPGGGVIGSYASGTQESRPTSANGRRVFFAAPYTAGELAPLYMRVDGNETILLSKSQRTGDDPTVPHGATFNGASKDGSVVYFSSFDFLTDDDSGGLYRLDVDTGQLTLVTPDPDGDALIYRVLYVSEDGSTAYFTTRDKLAGAATEGAPNFYAYRNGQLDYVGTFGGEETGGGPAYSSSPNGRFFAFSSAASFTGYDNTNPACKAVLYFANPEGTCTEVYVYDAEEKTLACPGCEAASPADNRNSDLLPHLQSISEHAQRNALDDGRVFYTSETRLVPGDINGRRDVYQWKEGANTLISTGRSREDSGFSEASTDGDSAFFLSSERLVAADTDEEADLYVARVDGGIPSQNQPPEDARACTGEGCQGALSAAPGVLAPASSVLAGTGNAKAKKRGRAHKRSGAVRACKKKPKAQRKKCESQVTKRHRAHTTAKSKGSK